MEHAQFLADLKKHWLWAVLALTLVFSALMGPESEPDPVPEPKSRSGTSVKSAEPPLPVRSTAFRDLPASWPERKTPHGQVRDIFQSPQVAAAAAAEKAAQAAAAKTEPVRPPTPQEQFAFQYFGQISQGSQKSVFLLGPGKAVTAVEVGHNINPDWKLLTLETQAMTLQHLPTGQTFQYSFNSTP